MTWSKKLPNHKLCDNCNQATPVSSKKAVRDGNLFFCEDRCRDTYLDAGETSLPFARDRPKPLVMNGFAPHPRRHQ